MLFTQKPTRSFMKVTSSPDSDNLDTALGLVFGKRDKNKFEFDAVIKESFTLSNAVTENPLENGSFFSDHITNKPEKLSLQVVVSDTPLPFVSIGFSAGYKGLSSDEYQRLAKIWESRSTLLISTGFQVYKDYVFNTIAGEKNKGDAAYLTIEFVKYRTFDTTNGKGAKKKVSEDVSHSVGVDELVGVLPLLAM